jgi:hypothetical protein
MRAIDKFILHVVHNWKNELNEAYSEKAITGFINKFKEEADDLNIKISDEQLRKYINTFDRIKEKLPNNERDLSKWTLAKFIRVVSAVKGEEEAEEIEITPDVVYHNDDNTIVIYNGSKEDNCVRYGNGEKWCITRGSYASYRYREDKNYPTFYLARNSNLSDSDKLSFVAIQVRDPEETRDDNRYVYTNRNNSPYESSPMSFENLLSEIPWLRNIPNLRSILKYIPLTSQELLTQKYAGNPVTYREWTKFPYSVKEQYLVVRKKSNQFFSDISNKEFVENHLSKYPELANFVAITPGIVDSITLVGALEKFPDKFRRSIISNLFDKIKIKELPTDKIPFEVKKLLVKLNKWELEPNERLYINKEGDTIIKLTLGDNIKVGLYQAEDDFPNIKLNKRTSKYLIDYPELDKIPLKNLLKLAEDEIIDKNLITKVLNNAKSDPNSALIVKPVESGEIILDSNSFLSYKVGKDGKITTLPFNNEEVQQVFADAKDNEAFQQNALNLFKPIDRRQQPDIPETIDKDALLGIIRSIPFNQRTIEFDNYPIILLTTDSGVPFFTMRVNPVSPEDYLRTTTDYGTRGDWRKPSLSKNALDDSMMQSYFTYLRQINKSFNDNELLSILKSTAWVTRANKKTFIQNNPPVNTNNRYKAVMNGNTALLIDSANPRESFKVSDNSGKLVKANVPAALARQLIGGQAAAAPGAGNVIAPVAGRRGRPAGVRNTPAAAPAPAAAGDINVEEVMQETGLDVAFLRLPRADRRRLAVDNASRVDPNGDRGAARRNNILVNRGRVGRVLSLPSGSKIYIIRLANQQIIASINIQPGNRNYILTGNANGNTMVPLNSPSELLQALQQRGLAEIQNYLVNEYLGANPTHITEFKQILRKHINEKKNENK